MKKIKIIIVFIFTLPLVFNSCNTDLTEELKGSLSEGTLVTDGDAFALVDGCYQVLIGDGHGFFSRGYALTFDGSTDCMVGARNSALDTYKWSENVAEDLWNICYTLISRANTAIKLIEKMDDAEFDDAAIKLRLIGEVKFLRAFAYNLLTSAFGDVIMSKDEIIEALPRTAVADVHTFIKEDLNYAISNLPLSYATEIGRATKGAAKNMFVKVLLREKNYSEANKYLDEIISSKIYDLYGEDGGEGVYGELWLESRRKDNEFIFTIMSHGEDYNAASNHHIKWFSPWGYDLSWASNVGVPESIYNKLEPEDERNSVIVNDLSDAYYGYVKGYGSAINWLGHAIFLKYSGNYRDVTAPDNPWGNYANSKLNFPIYRFADVLLLKADVENELNGPNAGAYAAINRVRTRVGIAELAAGMSKEEFRAAVLQERAIELVGEGHRRDDIIRHGVFEEKLNTYMAEQNYVAPITIVEAHRLFPIPRVELDLNPNVTPNPSNDLATY